MARPIRIEYAGALYHVTARGNAQQSVYLMDADRIHFLNLLEQVCDDRHWRCHAYCLMSNHYHLLIETIQPTLSKGMRALNGEYAQKFNKVHSRVGHLFQGRYKAILVQKESHLLELARYIVLNPIRANMVPQAHDWPWSSYCATAGVVQAKSFLETDWILAQFGQTRQTAIRKYIQFVAAGVGVESPWRQLKNQVYLGSDEFIVQALQHAERKPSLKEIPRLQKLAPPKPLVYYQKTYAQRNEAIVHAYLTGHYSLTAVGDYFGVGRSTVARAVASHKRDGKWET